MHIQLFICILLFYFLKFSYCDHLKAIKLNPDDLNLPKPWKENVKREISLEVFSDIKELKKNNSDIENDVINVCGTENGCECSYKALLCLNEKVNTTNLRPIIENFVIEVVRIEDSKTLTIEKGKTFPGNEETIKWLELSHLKIIKIDTNVFDDFTSLESLRFYRTEIFFFDENILTEKVGKSLQILTLMHCDLNDINLSIFGSLTNLKQLELNQNKQKNGKFKGKFPESLSKLKTLDLEFCNLTYLDDDTFENLKSLEELYISNNKFTLIPSAIKVLTSLKTFEFNNNELKKLKRNDFSSNINLELIFLTNNLKLEIVENCAFCNQEKLKQISFMGCEKLTYINENAFGTISNGYSPLLKVLNIERCNISVLHENLLEWKNIRELYLNENPFACNCSMAWLFKDLMSKNSIYESKLAYWFEREQHHKFHLGCLGPPPTTPNHTFPYTIVEIFSSCKIASSSKIYWLILILFGFIVLIVGFVYPNRSRMENVFSKWF